MSDSWGNLGFTCLGKPDLMYQSHFCGSKDLLLGLYAARFAKVPRSWEAVGWKLLSALWDEGDTGCLIYPPEARFTLKSLRMMYISRTCLVRKGGTLYLRGKVLY